MNQTMIKYLVRSKTAIAAVAMLLALRVMQCAAASAAIQNISFMSAIAQIDSVPVGTFAILPIYLVSMFQEISTNGNIYMTSREYAINADIYNDCKKSWVLAVMYSLLTTISSLMVCLVCSSKAPTLLMVIELLVLRFLVLSVVSMLVLSINRVCSKRSLLLIIFILYIAWDYMVWVLNINLFPIGWGLTTSDAVISVKQIIVYACITLFEFTALVVVRFALHKRLVGRLL
jgi:hypothetical protein